ncbi:phosphonate C-P lyase system protein PhnL [Sphingobium sp. OAS761]|uniref:phosphonate C-P lyase system protein PhnL n=1 Tax=Sphingobium sp. OAS761 TaxID=2817901 RepID=UPI00209DD03D|nr:phosphonate C-P lyase system protein PhnL [Sphingobium sp. OAS761]
MQFDVAETAGNRLAPDVMIDVSGLSKSFTIHAQSATRITALRAVSFQLRAGECVALTGPSGAGKSTLLRCIYGNYLATCGTVSIRDQKRGTVTVTGADPREIIALRKDTIGYVSQFLRAIPRVGAQALVASPLVELGVKEAVALRRAAELLERLAIPQKLWALPPATFSGGEQQRINIARGLIADHPILLLDEPTASLDAANSAIVSELILERRNKGTAIMGIFHDEETRDRVATRLFPLQAA